MKEKEDIILNDKIIEKINKVAVVVGLENNSKSETTRILNNILDKILEMEQDLYFKSSESKYIFALTEVDVENRANILGINLELYQDKEKAKEWFNSIAKVIHPDKSKHPNADKAMMKLNELYKGMKEDDE